MEKKNRLTLQNVSSVLAHMTKAAAKMSFQLPSAESLPKDTTVGHQLTRDQYHVGSRRSIVWPAAGIARVAGGGSGGQEERP